MMVIVAQIIAILAGVAILVGGVVLFAAGRGRGALSGAGFVILAVGTLVGTTWWLVFSDTVYRHGWSVARGVTMATVVQLLFNVVGWTLLIIATARLQTPAEPHGTPPTPSWQPAPGPPPPGQYAPPAPADLPPWEAPGGQQA